MIEGKRYFSESDCESIFRKIGPIYNANTPENHPIVFANEQEYMAGMSILAVCTRLHSGIKIYSFQLMSNHVHLVVGGQEEDIMDFFDYFAGRLDKYFDGQVDLSGFNLKLFSINDLSYFRNAIVYVNRNGFVVNDDTTPFSYQWGTGIYFFQPMACRYMKAAGKPIGTVKLRKLLHSRYCDEWKDLKEVDGYVSPLEFCDIATAESLFRDAKQYFYYISRNVETYAEVAKSLGESVYFNDNDLYLAAVNLARTHFGTKELRILNANNKLELAKRLHFDYNASKKQLQRLLKVNQDILNAIF